MAEEDRQIKYIKVGMDFTNTVTQRIMENLEGDERDEHLNNMRSIMVDYLKMEHEYNTARKVIASLKKDLEAENADMNKDIEEDYNKNYQDELKKIGKTQEDYKNDDRYVQLDQKISGGDGGGDDDEDLVMTGHEDQIPKDPWSLKEVVDPVKNKACNHIYEKAVVEKNISRSGKKPLKCPVVGCVNPSIKMADLISDVDTIKKIKKKRKLM